LEERRRRKTEENQGIKIQHTYEGIMTEDLPKYLQGKMKKKDRSLIARYRCGNELKGGQYWREIEERTCRICGRGEESLTHVLKECEATRDNIQSEDFLSEEGGGLEIMRKIERERRKQQEKEEKTEAQKGVQTKEKQAEV